MAIPAARMREGMMCWLFMMCEGFVFCFFCFCLLVGKGSVFLLGYVVLFVFDCWF